MPLSNAIIHITNLRLRTLIGFNDEERIKPQDIVINVEIHYPFTPNLVQDHVQSALDYKVITKRIIKHVEEGQFLLLEKLTADLLGLCSAEPVVTYCKIKIDKPHALRFADSVSSTLEYKAD
ncbi:MAG TPA: dihydroneopterin triphosphate 2'-epimerase [Cellvibrionaceae bacterium]